MSGCGEKSARYKLFPNFEMIRKKEDACEIR